MKEESKKLLEKALRAIEAAQVLLNNDQPEFAAGRAYYAMFYAAEALLNEKGLKFSKHAGVQAALGEHYIKTGLLDVKYHRWLLDAFAKRIVADYGVEVDLTSNEVSEMVFQAGELIQEIKKLIWAERS
jgi:uncharacterized protein (UPF0332 family)